MKIQNTLVIILLIISVSCKKTDKLGFSSSDIQLSYYVDTIFIDSKENFLFLNMDLFMSDFSEKDSILYNLNPFNGKVEVIDIYNSSLAEVIQYEIDGPNSIRTMFTSGIRKGIDGDIFFLDQYIIHWLDSSNQKKFSIRIDKESLKGDKLPEMVDMDPLGVINSMESKYVTFYREYPEIGGKVLGIALIDLLNSSLKLIPVRSLSNLNEFDIKLKLGENVKSIFSEYNFLSWANSNVIISNSAENKLWFYDSILDSVIYFPFNSRYISDTKYENGYIIESDEERFDRLVISRQDEVAFGPIIQDTRNNLFYRFSQEFSKYIDGEKSYKNVLTIFDRNFSVIHEELLEIGDVIPIRYFSGKTFILNDILYFYLNIDDEMAFIRLHLRFNDL